MSSVAFVVSSAYFWVVHHKIPLNNQILGIQKIDCIVSIQSNIFILKEKRDIYCYIDELVKIFLPISLVKVRHRHNLTSNELEVQ